jgi:hypothetical protein
MYRLEEKKRKRRKGKLHSLLHPVVSLRLPLHDVVKKSVWDVEQEVGRLNKRSDTGFSGLPTPRCPAESFLLVLNLNVRKKRSWKRKKADTGATAFHFEYSPARKAE